MELSETFMFVNLPLWMHFWLAAERQISVAELRDVVAFALLINPPSIAVMERLRFVPQVEFDRPAGRHRFYRKALFRVPRYPERPFLSRVKPAPPWCTTVRDCRIPIGL